jgi:hypothetical protein
MRTAPFAAFAVGSVLGCAGAVLAQAVDVGVHGGGGAGVARIEDPADPRLEQHRATQRERLAAEREMRRLRVEFFDNIRNVEIRQIGIAKLRQWADRPFLYPALLREFARSGDDVRGAILDMLADQQSDEGDTTLAWTAVFDNDRAMRDLAASRLQRRIGEGAGATERIRRVLSLGLKPSATEQEMATAATLASQLRIVELIPLLINAQAGGTTTVGGGGGGGESSLAWILIGTQTAFVADLEPVVGNNAVAFDPQIAVVTEGTVLRIIDAHVITYRMEVHHALVRLSSDAWGRPTGHFGFDVPRWREWYAKEFLPHLNREEEKRRSDQETR